MAEASITLQTNRRENARMLRRAADRVAKGQRIVVFHRTYRRKPKGRRSVLFMKIWFRRIRSDHDLERARALEGFVAEMTLEDSR